MQIADLHKLKLSDKPIATAYERTGSIIGARKYIYSTIKPFMIPRFIGKVAPCCIEGRMIQALPAKPIGTILQEVIAINC